MADFITHPIGPAFSSEITAAGLYGALFSWQADGVQPDPLLPAAQLATLQAVVAAHDATKPAPAVAPDCLSLAFWLTGLDLWVRTDSTGATVTRTADVQAAVAKLVAAGSPLGKLASRQLEYANTVLRADLLKLAPAFGFTLADCDESLWRASLVAAGDLRGVWPPPAS